MSDWPQTLTPDLNIARIKATLSTYTRSEDDRGGVEELLTMGYALAAEVERLTRHTKSLETRLARCETALHDRGFIRNNNE